MQIIRIGFSVSKSNTEQGFFGYAFQSASTDHGGIISLNPAPMARVISLEMTVAYVAPILFKTRRRRYCAAARFSPQLFCDSKKISLAAERRKFHFHEVKISLFCLWQKNLTLIIIYPRRRWRRSMKLYTCRASTFLSFCRTRKICRAWSFSASALLPRFPRRQGRGRG